MQTITSTFNWSFSTKTEKAYIITIKGKIVKAWLKDVFNHVSK